MDLKENDLKIFYGGGFNEELDVEIEKVLGAFGYERWASGMELGSKVRDLAFERIDHNTIDAEGEGV